jgi:hypothetical protein
MSEDEVVLALESHQPSLGDPACQRQTMLERHSSIPAAV